MHCGSRKHAPASRGSSALRERDPAEAGQSEGEAVDVREVQERVPVEFLLAVLRPVPQDAQFDQFPHQARQVIEAPRKVAVMPGPEAGGPLAGP